MSRLSRSDLEAAMPLLERLPEPALWIEPDYRIRWRNAQARLDYGTDEGACYEVSHGRRAPCDEDSGEICPKHRAEEEGVPREAFHAHCRRKSRTGVYRVLAMPIEGGGVLELHSELGRGILYDTLTGLYRREHWLELVERDLALLERLDRPYAVVFADVDRFKQFNDTHGHLVGDELLRQLGATIRRHVRKSDLACRWGGEEFVLFLPNTPGEQALQLAERIRAAVQRLRVEPATMAVTASFGVHADSARHPVQEVLRKADEALYAAKAKGRNHVCAYGAPPDAGEIAAVPE